MIGENDYETNKRLKLKNIWITGKDGLTLKDAAFSLIEEARFIIQVINQTIFQFQTFFNASF